LFEAPGSVRQLADAAALVTDTYLYDSFGNTLAESGSSVNPYRFIGGLGYYQDPDTGAYYIRSRYLNTQVARFLSRDEARWNIAAFRHGASQYGYSRNGPTRFVDPSGQQARGGGWPERFMYWWWIFGEEWWGYGNYCGWYRRGQGGDPIDYLDWACQQHDNCQATWATCNPVDLYKCSAKLCDDASLAYDFLCDWEHFDSTDERENCKRAARDIMALFCTVTGVLIPVFSPPFLPLTD
jgi:RHS repeat-associated protein